MATKEEQEIFLKAVQKTVGAKTATNCPICGHNEFSFQGVYYHMTYQRQSGPDAPALIGTTGMPVAIAMCTKCAYLIQFAWLPLERMVKDG